MEIIKTLISGTHTISATLSIIIGAIILFNIKGSRRHKKLGLYYFYCMLANNITALFIYNAFGKWFFPHTLAVITLIIIIPGFLITLTNNFKSWLTIHIICLVLSYYLLIGGAINEAFIRIPILQTYFYNNSPILGLSHMTTMLFFLGLIIYFLSKYRKSMFQRHHDNGES